MPKARIQTVLLPEGEPTIAQGKALGNGPQRKPKPRRGGRNGANTRVSTPPESVNPSRL